MLLWMPQWKGPRGRPKMRCQDCVEEDWNDGELEGGDEGPQSMEDVCGGGQIPPWDVAPR